MKLDSQTIINYLKDMSDKELMDIKRAAADTIDDRDREFISNLKDGSIWRCKIDMPEHNSTHVLVDDVTHDGEGDIIVSVFKFSRENELGGYLFGQEYINNIGFFRKNYELVGAIDIDAFYYKMEDSAKKMISYIFESMAKEEK